MHHAEDPAKTHRCELCTCVQYICQGPLVRYGGGGADLVRRAAAALRTSVFADMAALTVRIAGDSGRYGKDAKKIVRDAWKNVGL